MSLKELCQKIKADADRFTGEAEHYDDLTMLCLSLNMLSGRYILTNASFDSIAEVTDKAERILDELNAGIKTKNRFMVALDEIYSNIVRYSGASRALISFQEDEGTLSIVFLDNGVSFNPLESTAPDTGIPLDDRPIGGLGIFMVKKMMDSITYENVNGINCLTLSVNVQNAGV